MREMRRKDRKMSEEFALSVLKKCEYSTLAMVNEEGRPYCIPVSPVLDEERKAVYFHCAGAGYKVELLKKHPEVCMSGVGETRLVPEENTTEFESFVLEGRAEFVGEEEEKIHALRLIMEKFAPSNIHNFQEALDRSLKITAVVKISIRSISGKRKKYDTQGKEMKWQRME
ncbi:pyridoxamine 5'-phosphate oxidase family protein [Filifactor villosus]|uniref:Pyridoxamine 5'-phosphate oxidase family protein n=1 Tax=Filifactor villosus TaxID=29374 RepID=A0ABV9QNQ1_9FIRM